MVNKVKVLIGDDSVEYGIACASTLRGQGMYVMTRPKDGTALLETIKSDAPDVVVMDAILPHMDAIELMKKVQASGGKRPPIHRHKRIRQSLHRKAGDAGRCGIFHAQAL